MFTPYLCITKDGTVVCKPRTGDHSLVTWKIDPDPNREKQKLFNKKHPNTHACRDKAEESSTTNMNHFLNLLDETESNTEKR